MVQVHSKNFNVGVQALLLLDKISSKNQVVSDRFYRALYSKLLLPAAMNTSKVSDAEIWPICVCMVIIYADHAVRIQNKILSRGITFRQSCSSDFFWGQWGMT